MSPTQLALRLQVLSGGGSSSMNTSPPHPQDFFKHLDVLVFVEATIYQLDEDNEALAAQGRTEPGRRLLGEVD
eukprot:1134772-Pelagomonas_calceolata.AAC.2